MSHITMFPTGVRSRWKKRMIENIKALPRPTYTENVQIADKVTGKTEVKLVRKLLSDNDIRKIVDSRLELSNEKQ